MFRLARSLHRLSNNSSVVRHASGFKKVAVVGLGLMGHGVAQVTAQAGFEVLAIESNEKALQTGIKRIEGSLSKVIAKEVKKGTYKSEEEGKTAYNSVMQRISTTTNMEDAKDCDLIIEAIAEIESLKIDFYKKLGPIAKPDCVFASNTSSLAITPMAIASGRPEKFVGLHFFNPVQMMKLVEVIKTDHTASDIFDRTVDFGKEIGKVTVSCGDTPGFIVNRLLVPFLCQAMAMVDRKVASIKDIDASMVLGAGHPMGPLVLADYIGLDTVLQILQGWKKEFPNEPSFFVPSCLEEMVKSGNLGRKTGQGFYKWNGDKVADSA